MRRLALPVLAAVMLVVPTTAQAWAWPATGAVLAPFVYGDDPYAGGLHRGIDVEGEQGEAVRAPASGMVTFAGTVGANGKVVTVETESGHAVTLVHLGSTTVKKGDAVREGSVVGTIGPSGTPEHDVPYVHLGVRVADDPQGYIDPLSVLPPRGAPASPPPPAISPAPAPQPTPAPAPAPPVHEAPPAGPAPEPVEAPADAVSPVEEAAVPAPVAVAPAEQPVVAGASEPAVVAGSIASSAELPRRTGADARRLRTRMVVGAATQATGDATQQRRAEHPSNPRPRSLTTGSLQSLADRRTDVRAGGPKVATGDPRDTVIGSTPPHIAIPAPAPEARSAGRPWLAPAFATFAFLALLVAGAWRVVPKLRVNAVLPDDADLLREREAAHRPRVHDDRSRHPRPAPSPAG